MPADAATADWAGFRARFDGWLYSDRPHLLPLARTAGLVTSLRHGRPLLPSVVVTGPTLHVGGPLLRSLDPRNRPRIQRALARHAAAS